LGAVTRALFFFALLAAFVVGARCLSAFMAPPDQSTHGVALRQASHAPAEQESGIALSLDDDSDDGVDALLAPSPSVLELQPMPRVVSAQLGEPRQQRALQSHARGFERPPRA
jgi:hypothetical protein